MNDMFKGIIIDPGHGGVDSGATSNNALEKDYTLLISKYMYDRFKELGVPVYLTRDSDITLNPNDRVRKILSFLGNDPNVVLISNHLNAGNGDGAEVIYALRNDSRLANGILTNIGNTGENIRKVYQRRLPSNPMLDYYYILRETGKLEPLIVEYGFIDNPSDLNFIKNNYKELAEAVIKAVLEYKGIPYIPPQDNNTNTYQVVKGDTLYGISKKFNTSVDEIKKINDLTSNQLSIGEILKIPGNDNNQNVYQVVKGDTLYSIAKKFNTTIDKLKEVNKLDSNMLSIGDKLIIPVMEDTTYVVKAGDSLYKIAKMFNTSVDELKRLNNLVSDILNIGQILILK
ncbi:MAG: LysM peptidoglycan-binding domain-containing protein [Bacilli bacterium]|nr:LysM peptidoglycan-binding domain-containing protein [Bacilli bacterium]